jgi:adenosylhomocysteinase
MDMSFANQALSAEYLYNNKGKLAIGVHVVPPAMDAEIGRLKLKSMGIAIDVLSAAQQKYQDSWQEGT